MSRCGKSSRRCCPAQRWCWRRARSFRPARSFSICSRGSGSPPLPCRPRCGAACVIGPCRICAVPSPAEREVAAVWQEVLDLEGLGVHDNFFELGGQSLLAAQIVTRLNDRVGSGIALRQIFETPTIAGLAAALSTDAGEAQPGSAPPGSAAAQ
nr:phosphopantetheine-binding protein [Stappia taiwanensis]